MRAPCVTVLTILVLAAGSAPLPAQSFQWEDWKTACQRARREKKLLLVVQGPDDVSRPTADSQIAKELLETVFGDVGLKDFYGFRLVATYRATGPPPQASALRKTSTGPSHPNVLAYFCLVDGDQDIRVLHFVVGYPTSLWMQTQCDFAYKTLLAVHGVSSEGQPAVVADAHRKRLVTLGESLPAFQAAPELSRAVDLATQFRDTQLRAWFGDNWTPEQRKRLVASLRPHAELQPYVAHQVLSWHPLARLAELEALAFPRLTRQPYWAPPRRLAELTAWFRKQRAAEQPLLLVLSPTGGETRAEVGGLTIWQPKRAAVRRQLAHFGTLELNATELLCLIQAAEIKLPDAKTFQQLRFVVVHRTTGKVDWLTDRDELKLSRFLQRAGHAS